MDQRRFPALVVIFLAITISVTYSFPSGNFRKRDDACANLKQAYLNVHNSTEEFDVKYTDVKNCYETFPYNYTRASEIIHIFRGLYENFYVFLDQAKEQPNPGFDFRSVDLLKEFDLLFKKDYHTDFEFMSAVLDLLNELKDAHVSFNPLCYNTFVFRQGIYLSSIIKPDGTQAIQVLNNTLNLTINSCEVTHINGRSAFDVIFEYAKTKIASSRDLGVRFNNALASLSATRFKPGEFFYRFTLPETEIISYDIVCPEKKLHLDNPWKISIINNSFFEQFDDANSYFNNFCANPGKKVSTGNSINRHEEFDDHPTVKSLLNVGSIASFFQVDDIGVVTVSSFSDDNHTTSRTFPEIYNGLIDGFNLLAQANVKKLVLDFTNNPGGTIEFSTFLNTLLLYKKDINTFPGDYRVSEIAKLAIDKSTSENIVTDFDARIKSNIAGYFFNTSEEFLGNNNYERGGSKVRFTNKFFNGISNYTLASINNITKLPWEPYDMVILTNGNCGSSCALTTVFLSEIGQVSTVSVGGFYGKPLSFASFVGGQVIPSDTLVTELISLGLNSTTDPSLYNVKLLQLYGAQFPLKEVYSLVKPDEVLEFQFRPAQHRLYYDEENSKNITKLWHQAVSFIN
ncbi:363_t:CDS:2 [Acaulospora morrowiae]|uniref:363_t:CDS:1 n=1 Tax=Acaulospora morrowiae TaxID=94023 RepID=A0A9N8VQK6_9GLOM|nr:363_t:CDS:2 [Acaulospora morrowiae]